MTEENVGRELAKIIGQHLWEEITDSACIDEIEERIPLFKRSMEENYCISDVWYDGKEGFLFVKTSRPGIIIGVKGANIDAISERCSKWATANSIKFKGIRLREDLHPLKDDLLYPMHRYMASYPRYI
jgi:predicted metal-dependent RNase